MKGLLVLIDNVDLRSIDNNLLARCDRLALSPSAGVAFEQNNLSYLTCDDFYGYRQFRADNIRLIHATKDLFSALDKKYQPYLNFPRIFSGNIYWFLLFFADLYYIAQICKRLKSCYADIYFAGSKIYDGNFNIEIEFSPSSLFFSGFHYGKRNKVSIFRDYLSPQCIWLASARRNDFFANFNRYRLISLAKRVSRKILLYPALFQFENRESQIIFNIQDDAYDVKPLRKHMEGFSQINPLADLFRPSEISRLNRQKIDFLFTEELKAFIGTWFPKFESHISKLFTLYHNKIAEYFTDFSRQMERSFNRHNPVALFYPVGAALIYENLFGYFATKNKIPVFYFQHGGATVFTKDPYLNIFEYTEGIRKINIFHSKVEKELFNREASGNGIALGSPKFYNLFLKYTKFDLKKSKKVLFGVSCYTTNSYYKYLMASPSDAELFAVHKEIIGIVHNLKLRMDIKTHPSDEHESFLCFSNFLRNYPGANIRVLRRIYAEEIIKNYGLLILDSVGTVLAPWSFILDLPVILYLKDLSTVEEQIIPDLKRRFYLASTKADVENYIRQFANGSLPSKFSREFIDKYVFPVDSGNPAVNIGNYIKHKINEYAAERLNNIEDTGY